MANDLPLILAASSPDVGRDEADTTAGPNERAGQFIAVAGPESEQVSASGMVVAAYGLFWLIVFAVVVQTYWSQVKLAARVAELEKKLPKGEQPS
jgi:hypothetical protein